MSRRDAVVHEIRHVLREWGYDVGAPGVDQLAGELADAAIDVLEHEPQSRETE